jgi:hypothetical protein
MADITTSLEELTEALQALAAETRDGKSAGLSAQLPANLSPETFSIPDEIIEFVKEAQEYSSRTRGVSIGSY